MLTRRESACFACMRCDARDLYRFCHSSLFLQYIPEFFHWNGFTKNIPLGVGKLQPTVLPTPSRQGAGQQPEALHIGLAATMTISLFFAVNITRARCVNVNFTALCFFSQYAVDRHRRAPWTFIFTRPSSV
jgi:hypothetical protein